MIFNELVRRIKPRGPEIDNVLRPDFQPAAELNDDWWADESRDADWDRAQARNDYYRDLDA